MIGVLPWIPQANQEVIEMEHWMKPLAKAIFLNNQHQHKEALREVHSVEKLFRNARFVKELVCFVPVFLIPWTLESKHFDQDGRLHTSGKAVQECSNHRSSSIGRTQVALKTNSIVSL